MIHTNKKIYLAAFAVLIGGFVLYSGTIHSRGNCWGVFQKKAECEAEYRYKRDEKVCKENSWDACERVSKSKGAQYCSCLDRVRNSCMRSLGWSDTIGYSACDGGDSSD